MLINVFGAWVNPQNIISVIADGEGSKVIFSNNGDGFTVKFPDKSPADVATAINNAVAAGRKSAFGDREKKYGDKNRRDFKGGREGGFEKKFDRNRGERSFGDAKGRDGAAGEGFDKKRTGGKFESKSPRGEFKPKGAFKPRGEFTSKKRKEW